MAQPDPRHPNDPEEVARTHAREVASLSAAEQQSLRRLLDDALARIGPGPDDGAGAARRDGRGRPRD
jgi:hypothetical protein